MSTSSDPKPSQLDLELFARVEGSTPGTFKIYSAGDTGVEQRIQQHLINLDEIHGRVCKAVAAGCHIESISLRLQIIDYWLRLYFVNIASSTSTRKREFGALLDQCRDLGLDGELHQSLKNANTRRVDAIHGFVIGSIAYEQLAPVAEEFSDLVKGVVEFVAKNCGTVVTSREQLAANPGACVLHVEGFCHDVLSGARY